MKRFVLTAAFLFLCSAFCFSQVPEWYLNVEEVFPSAEYIRGVGEGSSETAAKKMAAAEISAWFSQKVSSKVTGVEVMDRQDSVYSERSRFTRSVTTSSQGVLFCVQYTDCFYDSVREKYVVAAFVEKAALWKVLCQKMDGDISLCTYFTRQSEGQTELFEKVVLLNRACRVGRDFDGFYQMALVLWPDRCGVYTDFFMGFRAVEGRFEELRKKVLVQVRVEGDRQDRILRKLSEVLGGQGFFMAGEGNCLAGEGNCMAVEGNCLAGEGNCGAGEDNCVAVEDNCGAASENCGAGQDNCAAAGENCGAVEDRSCVYVLNAEINWNESVYKTVHSSCPEAKVTLCRGSQVVRSFALGGGKCSAYSQEMLENMAMYRLEKALEEKLNGEWFYRNMSD